MYFSFLGKEVEEVELPLLTAVRKVSAAWSIH